MKKTVRNTKHSLLLKHITPLSCRTLQYTNGANKPNTTIKDLKNNTCLLTEIMFRIDKNLSTGEFSNTTKYKDLEIEVE